MENKFLASVADVFGYDENDVLVLEGNALLNTTLNHAVSDTDVRAGEGAKLQFVYKHSGELTGDIENAAFSMDMIGLAAGKTVTTGSNIWTEETVTLANGAGSVVGTPLGFQNTPVYAWVTYNDVVSERVVVTTKAFTIADTTYDGDVCVRYYAYDAAAKSVEIDASPSPSVIRLVLRVGVYSNSSYTSKIGEAFITIHRAQITGNFTISMTPDGVASTPISWRALAYTNTANGCTGRRQIYASIVESIYDRNWYDDVTALAVIGGDFDLAAAATKQLDVRAITSTDAFTPPYADLTFSKTGSITVTSGGLVTGATGGGTVKVTITAKTAVDTTVVVTDPA